MNHPPVKSPKIPTLLRGAVNAAANIGNVIGQLLFGFLGDSFGRRFVYGKELIVAIVGIIMVISLPSHHIEPARNKMWWLFGFRILLGIGIGGDYPMSAAIVAERSTLKNRGKMLGWIFSNQGWGTLASSIVTLIILGCFKDSLTNGHYGKLDGVWRLQIGLAIVPAAALLYFRLTMPEGRKFLQSAELSTVVESSYASSVTSFGNTTMEKGVNQDIKTARSEALSEDERRISVVEAIARPPAKNVQMRAFITYFSEWRHLKTLIGTAGSWFFVDIAFYGLNLNQTVLLTDINFAKGNTEWETLLKGAYGNLIIAAAGCKYRPILPIHELASLYANNAHTDVPGYFLTIAFIDIIGRKWIQTGGFLITALMFGIIAGDYDGLGTASKFALFTLAQLFFNFGPNSTTFIVPGEVYPSRVRGFAHGFSAATGKCGAILSGILFNYLSQDSEIGVANVLWIFFACNLAGAVTTVLFVPETSGIDADEVDWKECQEKAGRRLAR